jgi:prefoldin beta subunit
MEGGISLPPETQQTLMQLQTFQQQLEMVLLQKNSLTVQKTEIEKALEELEKTEEGKDVFKIVGPILVKTTKENLISELKEKLESIELRLKSLEKQEEKLREKIKEKQEKLKVFLENFEEKPGKGS